MSLYAKGGSGAIGGSGGGGGGGGTPGGTNGEIQYNNAGVFGGDAFFYTNGIGFVTAVSLTLGAPAQGGVLNIEGSGSGTISILPQVAAGTYNFNLPVTAGTSGYLLTSDGGGAGGGMTWTNPASFQAPITIGVLDAQAANANGLALVSNVLSSQSADATHPGMVNTTTQTFAGTKTFANIIDSGLTASQAVVTNGSKQLTSLSYTPSASASSIASRDINGSSGFTNVFIATISTVTSNQVITMTYGSAGGQIATGSANITYNLPDSTYLTVGAIYTFNNNSTGLLTVNLNDGTTLLETLPAGGYKIVTCTNNSTPNGVWDFHDSLARGSISGTSGTTVPGFMSANTLVSTVAIGTAPLTVTSTTLVPNLYVTRAALADIVTTNANLTGPITSVGNATSIASQTGTGTKFVVDTSPTLVTPNIGAATGTSLSVSGQLTSTVSTGTAPLVVSSTTVVANLNSATAVSPTTGSAHGAVTLNGSGQFQSVAPSTSGNVLTSNGTDWASTAPAASASSTVTQKSDNATYYPTFINGNTTGSYGLDVGTGLSFNPSTNIMTTTGLNLSGLTASKAVVTDSSKNLASLAYATAPAASTLAEWDANSNLSANNHIAGFRTQATANSTLALVIGDAQQQYFTGSTTGQIVTLPTTGVVAGGSYTIVNLSTATVTVQSSGGNTIQAMAANTVGIFTALVATPTTAANWNSDYQYNGMVLTGVSPTVSKATSSGTASGTGGFVSGTYTVPAGVQWFEIEACGGGGGGFGAGTSPSGVTGGGNTTFGTLTINGGSVATGNTGGAGGTIPTLASGYTGTALAGGGGFGGTAIASGTNNIAGGIGGTNPFGGMGITSSVSSLTGGDGAANTGAGGSGGGSNTAGISSASGGGSGAYIKAIYVPTAGQQFSYSVGSGGTHGSASLSSGGAGAVGYIKITEYYTNLAVGTQAAIPANQVMAGPSSGSAAQPTFRALVNADLPAGDISNLPGTVVMYAVSTAPTGWLNCDGSAVSRTTYAALFSAIGTSYGTGDGSTTFNVPNFKGIFPRGIGTQTINSISYSTTLGTSQNDTTKPNGLGGTFSGTTGSTSLDVATGLQSGYANSTYANAPYTALSYGANSGHTHSFSGSVSFTGDSETRPANLGINFIIKY